MCMICEDPECECCDMPDEYWDEQYISSIIEEGPLKGASIPMELWERINRIRDVRILFFRPMSKGETNASTNLQEMLH
jgi:hypothetical protein